MIDINKSNYSFEPDIENNQILFGLKALTGVNSEVIEQIVSNRPYTSLLDFMNKNKLKKPAMISLIKSGSFDLLENEWANELNINPRLINMALYLSIISEPKNKLTLQNFNGLINKNLIPDSLLFEKRVFIFNKYLKEMKTGEYYYLDEASEKFYFAAEFDYDLLQIINGHTFILQKDWDKIYKKVMNSARDWLNENQEEVLYEFNYLLFEEAWNQYAKGNISAWEMESLCFYYNKHELADVNIYKYGISDFNQLPESPVVDYFFKRNGKEIPVYKTKKIIGTVISKNDNRSSVDILTITGVVNVKFTKEYYAMYNRQLSEPQPDGTKKIVEKGWFTRGTKIMVTGFRRDDTFVAKSYAHTPTHQLYKIEDVDNNGNMILTHDRYTGEK